MGAMQTLTPQPHREADDQLADKYVQNFEFDHVNFEFDDVVETLPACATSYRKWPYPQPHQSTGFYPQPHVAIAVNPSIPPETPHASGGRSPCRAPPVDVLWLPHMREPLDRHTVPCGSFKEWDRRERREHQLQQVGLRPANSCSDISPHTGQHQSSQPSSLGENLISDDLLVTLKVSELNKRLHRFPQKDVIELKLKRRTLKNRVYARKCRTKTLKRIEELESANRALQDETHLLQLKVARVSYERDVLKQSLALVPAPRSSPEFFLNYNDSSY